MTSSRERVSLSAGNLAAWFKTLVLPTPFILALFVKQENKAELHSVDSTHTLHTIITILVFKSAIPLTLTSEPLDT